ncbi:hypothetical protein BDV26DRAFT_281791 [Aspergillus bertholletiae]|uniref:Altered inheritance of mitochondria protein 9, mitochondrial n=1 Tax=Aspergillus bertholletiae TaxID=1226010 RepID=A0A5N7B7A5_9EURO|nr:hypothetical protein BDV26DRAFT_281791 [Aspergillus bertholletiae]
MISINDDYCIGPVFKSIVVSKICLSDLGLALASYSFKHIKLKALIHRGPHFGTKTDHIQGLGAAMKVIPKLASYTTLQRSSRPTLWHGDLHLGHIFVWNRDSSAIVGKIDWQYVSIMPAFMQFGMVKPELPPNFDEMDPDEKTFAIAERNQALLSKCYEGTLVKHHLESYLALTRADSAIRRLFSSTDTTWKDGIVPLCDSLIQISEEWHQVGISEPCPYQIADGDLLKHRLELSQCRDWHELKAYTHELLQSDDDGWVPPQLDFDKVQLRHDELLQLYIQKESEELPEEEAKRLWFYTDRT